MAEVRKNSTETMTFSKLSARKMSKVGVSAKADTPKRRFRSQKICDAEIEVSAEAEVEVLLSRKLQNLSQCNRALTFFDRLTKYVHLVPTTVHVDSRETARLYIDHAFATYGLSKTIVCDQDPRFTSIFFKEVFNILGVELKVSTANHPQTNGMTERVNRIVEDTLRAFVNHRQNDWDELLSLCDFAIYNSDHSSTGNTPFFLSHGCHPITPSSLVTRQNSRALDTAEASLSWLDSR